MTPDTSQNVGAGSNYEIHLSDDSDGRVNQESDSDAALLRVFVNFGDDPDGDGDDTYQKSAHRPINVLLRP